MKLKLYSLGEAIDNISRAAKQSMIGDRVWVVSSRRDKKGKPYFIPGIIIDVRVTVVASKGAIKIEYCAFARGYERYGYSLWQDESDFEWRSDLKDYPVDREYKKMKEVK